jgi:hypothetical protein
LIFFGGLRREEVEKLCDLDNRGEGDDDRGDVRIDIREVQRQAISFALELKRLSRTEQAGDLRLAAAEYSIDGYLRHMPLYHNRLRVLA